MTHRPEAEIFNGDSTRHTHRSDLNLVSLQPTENPGRGNPRGNPTENPTLPPVTIEHQNHSESSAQSNSRVDASVRNNVENRNNAHATGGDSQSTSSSTSISSGGDGGNGGNASINDNSKTQYTDNSIYMVPVQVPPQYGDGIKVFSSVTLQGRGTNTISVDSGVDSRTFSAGIAIPGIGGITAGGGSADIPHEGQTQVQSAGNLMRAQSALFWGDALGQQRTTSGIGRELTEGGARVMQQELENKKEQ